MNYFSSCWRVWDKHSPFFPLFYPLWGRDPVPLFFCAIRSSSTHRDCKRNYSTATNDRNRLLLNKSRWTRNHWLFVFFSRRSEMPCSLHGLASCSWRGTVLAIMWTFRNNIACVVSVVLLFLKISIKYFVLKHVLSLADIYHSQQVIPVS